MNEEMLAVFTASCKEHQATMIELLKTYDLAKLGYEMQEEQCDEVTNLVLAENEFFVGREDPHGYYKFGARITDEKDTFMLSDEDFQRLLSLKSAILVERKITDEKGYYLTDWFGMKMDARRNLVDFIIKNVVPEFLRDLFWRNRLNVTFGNKLIDVFRKSLVAA